MSRRLLVALLALVVLVGGGTAFVLTRGASSDAGAPAGPEAGPAARPGLVDLPDQEPQDLEARLGERTEDVALFTLGAQTVTADGDDELATGQAPKTVDSAGLLVARTDRGIPVGLAISVRSSVGGEYPSTVDYTSTAFALLAQLPGFVSPDPKQMAVLRALAEGPELQVLADLLEAHAAEDAAYLMAPTVEETEALAALVEAVTQRLEAEAEQPSGSTVAPAAWSADSGRNAVPARARVAPPALAAAVPAAAGGDVECARAVVADLDGREGDGVCLSVKGAGEDLLTAPGKGDVEVDVVNHAGRWGLLYEQGSPVPLAVLPARAIDMPGISKSLTKLATLQTQLQVGLACKGLRLLGIQACPVKDPDDGYVAKLRDQFDVFKEGKVSVTVAAAAADENLLTYAPGRAVSGVRPPEGAEPLAAAANFVFVMVLPSIQVALDVKSSFEEPQLPTSFGRSGAGVGDGLQALMALSTAAQGELLQMTAPGASPSQRTKAFLDALEKTLANPAVVGKLLGALGFSAVDATVDWATKVAAKALIYAIPGPGWIKAAIDAADKVIDVVGLYLNFSALSKSVENDDAVDVYLPLRDPGAVRRAVAGEMAYAGTCFYGSDPVQLRGGVGRTTAEADFEGGGTYDTRVDVGRPVFLEADGRTYAVVTTHCRQSSSDSEFETWAAHLVAVGEDGRAKVLDVTTTSDSEPRVAVQGDVIRMRITSLVAREPAAAVYEVKDGKLAWRGQTCADVLPRVRLHERALREVVQAQGSVGARLLDDGRLWVAYSSSESGDPISDAYGAVGADPEPIDGGGDSYAYVRAVQLFMEGGRVACAPAAG